MFHLICAFLLAISPLVQAENKKQTVVFAGSSTIMPIIEDMSELLDKNGFELQVQGGGSSAGLKSTKMGLAQIGMVSRSLTEKEKSSYQNLVIAKDWVVLIANKKNSLANLNHQQVFNIYTGQQTQWKNKKTIHVIGKESGRATKKVFEKHFNLKSKVKRDAIIIGANGQAIASVANDVNAIAYVSYSAATEAIKNNTNIKIIKLDNVAGTPENVLNNTYSLTRSLNLVYLNKNKPLIKQLKEVFKSEEALKIFNKNHVMPVLI